MTATSDSRDTCWYCGGKICWDSDFPADEFFGDEEAEGIVICLHCPSCGAEIQYVILEAE